MRHFTKPDFLYFLFLLRPRYKYGTVNHDESLTPDERPDTTSHSFTWKVERFGEGSSSALYDVAIVSDTLAYAVGEIYPKDSTGQIDTKRFNVARWNDREWSIQRLYYLFPGINPIRSVLAFNDHDVWFGMGSLIHWDGARYVEVEVPSTLFPSIARKMWGTSSDDLYIVGNAGNLVHFDGGRWSKLETGTTLTIQDIWGAKDPTTGTLEIIAVASEPFYASRGRRILRVSGTTITTLSDSGITQTLTGVWFSASRGYYISGGGIFDKHTLNDTEWLNALQGSGITVQYLDAIRGNAVNDVFAVGANGDVLHFNGSSWRNFRDQTALTYGEFHAIAVRGDLVCAVGEDLSRAVIAIGRRQRWGYRATKKAAT
jgi:hypothetical protein